MSKKPVTIRMINKVENYLGSGAAYEEYERAVREEIEEDGVLNVMNAFSGDCFMGICSDIEGDAPSVMETKGELVEINGNVSVIFCSELSGVFPTRVEYRFDNEKRNSLAVIKSSIFEEVYFFDSNCKRQTIVYEADNSGIELSIYTKSLKNGITYENGGCLEIEYFAEIRGGIVEHCKEYMIVEVANKQE